MSIGQLRGPEGSQIRSLVYFTVLFCFFHHLRAPRESRVPREFQDPKACQASKEIRYHRRLENTKERDPSLGCGGPSGEGFRPGGAGS